MMEGPAWEHCSCHTRGLAAVAAAAGWMEEEGAGEHGGGRPHFEGGDEGVSLKGSWDEDADVLWGETDRRRTVL